jgi:prepilin-type N-terminal cleavage/methylation domain-containing protein
MPGFKFLAQKGFSLVEIAIVLVVVGLLVSGGLLGLAPVLQGNKISQTNAQMDKIEQALVLYVIQNGCLPCPAAPGATMTGQASDAAGEYSAGSCTSGGTNLCDPVQGPVPWVNLGLSRDDVIDAYGNFIDYAPSSTLNQSSTSMVRTPPSTYPAGTLDVDSVSGTDQTSAAAYVLISHGLDGSHGYTASSGTLRGDPNGSAAQSCNSIARTTCPGGITGFIQNQAQSTGATNGYFDDLVRFKTAPVIIQSCGSNACGNPA